MAFVFSYVRAATRYFPPINRYYTLIKGDLLCRTITTLCQRDIICLRETTRLWPPTLVSCPMASPISCLWSYDYFDRISGTDCTLPDNIHPRELEGGAERLGTLARRRARSLSGTPADQNCSRSIRIFGQALLNPFDFVQLVHSRE